MWQMSIGNHLLMVFTILLTLEPQTLLDGYALVCRASGWQTRRGAASIWRLQIVKLLKQWGAAAYTFIPTG